VEGISASGTSFRSMLLTFRIESCLMITIQECWSSRYLERRSSGDRESLANSALISFLHRFWTISTPVVRRISASWLATSTSHLEICQRNVGAKMKTILKLTLFVFQIPCNSSSGFFKKPFALGFGSLAIFSQAKLKPTACLSSE
jgi:hypothetical protein